MRVNRTAMAHSSSAHKPDRAFLGRHADADYVKPNDDTNKNFASESALLRFHVVLARFTSIVTQLHKQWPIGIAFAEQTHLRSH